MVLVKSDVAQTKWISNDRFNDIPQDHMARFLVDFIDEFLIDEIDEKLDKKHGRPIFPKKTLLKILVYAEINRASSTEEIADLVRNHHYYHFVAEDLKPSARTLRRFKDEYGFLFDFVLHSTIIKAKNDNITDFDHIAVDGTIARSNNSNYNIIKLEEIELLLNLLKLKSKEIDQYLKDKNREKLRRSAYNLLKNKNQSVDEKIDMLNKLKDILLESGQTSVGLSDYDARWMNNKKNQKELSFNVQGSADYKSGLILVLNATQDPTDRNQLIPQINNIKKVLGEYPTIISADYGFRTHENLKYLKSKGIDGYIPNQKQSRENKGKKTSNPYHKDYFIYDEEIDVYICPENQVLPFRREYTYKKKPRRLYYTDKCKICPVKEKCTQSNYRIISEFGNDIEKEMNKKMHSEHGKNEYSKRMKTIEPIFGVLKKQHNLNEMDEHGLEKIQTELNLMAVAYNLKQLHAHKMKDEKQKNKNLEEFKKDIQTRFPNGKLKLEIINKK